MRRFIGNGGSLGAALLLAFGLVALSVDTNDAQRRKPDNSAAEADKPKTPEEEFAEFAKIVAEKEALDAEQIGRAEALIPLLGSSDYDEREGALRELLLMPRGIAAPLLAALPNLNIEGRNRAWFILRELRVGAQVHSYLSRITGVQRADLMGPLSAGGAALDEVLRRIPPGVPAADPRVWSPLFLAAGELPQRERVLTLLRASGGENAMATLYRELLAKHEKAMPIRRAQLLDAFDKAPAAIVLELAEASADDPAFEVRRARRRLLARVGMNTDAAALLAEFHNTESVDRRRLLLELVRLRAANEATRAEWVAVRDSLNDPVLHEAYNAMAAREGLLEILEAALAPEGSGKDVFALLVAIGGESQWQRALDPNVDLGRARAALTWLPYSALPPATQLKFLRAALAASDERLRDIALAQLGGYSGVAVVQALLQAAEAADNPAPYIPALASHARHLPRLAPNLADKNWFAALQPLRRVEILQAYPDDAALEGLRALMYDPDPAVGRAARNAVATRAADFFGRQLLAARALGDHLANPAMLGSVKETPALALAELRLLEASRAEWQGERLDVRARHDQLHLALALEGFADYRRALKADEFGVAERKEYLLALFPDAEGAAELARAARNAPEMLLTAATQLQALRRAELRDALVTALTRAAQTHTVPPTMDPYVLAGICRDALRRSSKEKDGGAGSEQGKVLRELIEHLTRHESDAVASAPLLMLSLNSGPRAPNPAGMIEREPYLDLLMGVSQRSATAGYRRHVLLAAAAAPDLSHAWIEKLRTNWKDSEQDATGTAFSFLEALLEEDERPVLEFIAGTDPNLRSVALLAAARRGNRNALMLLFDEWYGGAEGASVPVGPAGALDLAAWCEGAPEWGDSEELRRFWLSTRLGWRFDHGTGRYRALDSE